MVAEQLRAAATLADPSSDAYEAAAQEAARVEDEEETARLRQESKREFLYSSNFKDKVLKKRALAAGVGEDDLKSAEDQEDNHSDSAKPNLEMTTRKDNNGKLKG